MIINTVACDGINRGTTPFTFITTGSTISSRISLMMPTLNPITTIQKASSRTGTSGVIFPFGIDNGTNVHGMWINPPGGGFVSFGKAVDFECLE